MIAGVAAETEPPLLIALVAPAGDFTAAVLGAIRSGTTASVAALALGLAGIAFVASRIARPLRALAREADRIRALDLAGPVVVQSRVVEIERLAIAMDRMKDAIRLFGS